MKTSRLIILSLLIVLSANRIFAGRYYDSQTGRWLSVDPKASKYPGWSSYNYCLNNPLRNIDPDGKEVGTPVYIGLETDGLGHAFIVSVDDNTREITAWSYGRYDGTSSGGSLNPVGDGVLVKFQGNEAMKYVSQEMQKKGGTLYEIPNTSTEKVNKHFQEMYDKSIQTSKRYSNNGKVIDTYSAPANSCVTKTVEGVTAGGGTVPKVTIVTPNAGGGVTTNVPPITPQELKDALNSVSEPKQTIQQ